MKSFFQLITTIFLSLWVITLFEVAFYFYYVTDIERDVTQSSIEKTASLMGDVLQQTLAGAPSSALIPPIEGEPRERMLLQVDQYLDTASRGLAPRLKAEKDQEKAAALSVAHHLRKAGLGQPAAKKRKEQPSATARSPTAGPAAPSEVHWWTSSSQE